MEQRFSCIACGKCCYGWLPLSIRDALRHDHIFPLAMIWTPIRQGSKEFEMAGKLGLTVSSGRKKKIAVRLTPASYIPKSFLCPALDDGGLKCSIHATKPSRCRTMPFYPYRDEKDQRDMLIPREGWECDVSDAAPVVYRDKTIIDRTDFDAERVMLEQDAPILKHYAERLLATVPAVGQGLERAAAKKHGGTMTLNFTGLVTRLKDVDARDFARRQLPVMETFAARSAGKADLSDYHGFYSKAARGMARLLNEA